MQQNDFEQFAATMLGLFEYYGREPSDAVVEIYWRGLKNYELAAIQDAVSRHTQSPDDGQFMPKIGHIVKMLAGSSKDRAFLAWTKVDKAVRQVGSYHDVVFDDPLIHRVLDDMGGWCTMADKSEEDWPFIAKDFEARYSGYAARSEPVEYPRVMIGLANAENIATGKALNKPIAIGNREQAILTYKNGATSAIKKIEIHDAARNFIGNKKNEKAAGVSREE